MPGLTGSYRLDAPSAQFFRAIRFRLISRAELVVGRYGRHGSIRAQLLDQYRLDGVWREIDRLGWLQLTFEDAYRAFDGSYGLGEEASVLEIGRIRGMRGSHL